MIGLKQPRHLFKGFFYFVVLVAIPFFSIGLIENLNASLPPDNSLNTVLFLSIAVGVLLTLLTSSKAFFDSRSAFSLLLDLSTGFLWFLFIVIALSNGNFLNPGISEFSMSSPVKAGIIFNFRFILLLFFISFILNSVKLFIDFKIANSK